MASEDGLIGEDYNKETHCDNPISLDEIENGLWLGMYAKIW